MGIGTFFSKASDLLAAQSPEQRALMLAVAGGVNPSPRMGQALIGQSQSAMQAIQAQEQRRMAEAQAEMDRQQRMAELQATLKDRKMERKTTRSIADREFTARREEAADSREATREYNLARLADSAGVNRERESLIQAQRMDAELKTKEQQMRLERAKEAIDKGDYEGAMRWMSGGYQRPDPMAAMLGGGVPPAGAGMGNYQGGPMIGTPQIDMNTLIGIGTGQIKPGQ